VVDGCAIRAGLFLFKKNNKIIEKKSVTGLNIASLLSENFYLCRLLFILVAVVQRLSMLQLFEI